MLFALAGLSAAGTAASIECESQRSTTRKGGNMYETAHPMAANHEVEEKTQRAAAPRPEMRADARLPDIGLTDAERQAVIGILNVVLADEFVLYTKTRRCHWNVVGPNFSELHALFQRQYEQLEEIIDDVAERIRALGGTPAGTL